MPLLTVWMQPLTHLPSHAVLQRFSSPLAPLTVFSSQKLSFHLALTTPKGGQWCYSHTGSHQGPAGIFLSFHPGPYFLELLRIEPRVCSF